MSAFGLRLIGDWARGVSTFNGLPERFQAALNEAAMEEGEAMRSRIVDQLTHGDFAPLSPLTAVFARGRTIGTPLSGLAKDVVVKRVGDAVFVGIQTSGSGSMSRADIAELHERGAEFDVVPSDKQRRFIMTCLREAGLLAPRIPGAPRAQPGGSGPGVIHIRIPARPWLQPVVDEWCKPDDVKRRFEERVTTKLRGQLGMP